MTPLQARQLIKHIKSFNKISGICHILMHKTVPAEVYFYCRKQVISICKSLGIYTNVKTYPIKHDKLPPEEAFHNCWRWSPFTKYGRRRRLVLKELIKHLESIAEGKDNGYS